MTRPLTLIKKRRTKLGLTQWQVAERIGITRSGYANMENGYRPIYNYSKRIARVLRVDR